LARRTLENFLIELIKIVVNGVYVCAQFVKRHAQAMLPPPKPDPMNARTAPMTSGCAAMFRKVDQ
jgi:hypothetical protein